MSVDFKERVYHLVRDKKEDFLIENINIKDDQLVVECSRDLKTQNEQSEDLPLSDDLLMIFFTVGSEVVGSDQELFSWDRGASQDSGEAVISLISYSDTAADLQTLEEFPSVTFSLARLRPHPDGEAQCRMFEVPPSARLYKGYAPAISGFNGDNGLIRSMILYQCTARGRVTGNEKCERFAEECSEVIFIWYPGSSGERLVADLRVSTDRVMLEVVYNSGTGWLYDSSGVQVYLSSRAPSETELATRLLLTTPTVELECEASLVSVSLHSNLAVDNIRLTADSDTVISGYQSHHQPTRHLLRPHNITRGSSLGLHCLQPRQCFALLTFKHQTTCGNKLTDKLTDRLNDQQNEIETSKAEGKKSSDKTTTRRERTNTARPVTGKITSITSAIPSDTLKTKDVPNKKMNFTKMEAETKSDLSYKNDIANLDIQPRLLDDAGEPQYTTASLASQELENKGEINFQNVYRNSSNLPLSHLFPFIVLLSSLSIWIKM